MKSALPSLLLIVVLGAVGFAQEAPKKITRSEALNAVSVKVQPDYPPVARQLRMQGAVELQVTIGETGEVTKVDIVSGNPVLTAPAAQAIKRWKFKPFVENGKAISVVAPIAVDFKL